MGTVAEPGIHRVGVPARLEPHSFARAKPNLAERDTDFACSQLSCRPVLDLDGPGFAACDARPRIIDSPHGSASFAHDFCAAAHLAGRAAPSVAGKIARTMDVACDPSAV